MKTIKYEQYNVSMGNLINVEDVLTYKEEFGYGANIPYEKLIYNKERYLTKGRPYYIICSKGRKSRKACSLLELYGYDVTQVIK